MTVTSALWRQLRINEINTPRAHVITCSIMAEGTYEYECMRAELLGIGKPDYDEFIKKQQERAAATEEEQEVENLKEVCQEEESMKHISGGLDELNNILQSTQKKIHKFKASCSSLTSLLKFKLGTTSSESASVDSEEAGEASVAPSSPLSTNGSCSDTPRKSDLSKALDNHVDQIDAMIQKAESAQYSMAHQNKEMKRFLQ